jgi:hypothetical protein
VLVLPDFGPYDPISRSAPLPERQITGGQGKGMRMKVTWRREGAVGESQMGATVGKVPGTIGGGEGDGGRDGRGWRPCCENGRVGSMGGGGLGSP